MAYKNIEDQRAWAAKRAMENYRRDPVAGARKTREYRQANPHKAREFERTKHGYPMSEPDWQQLFRSQDKRCAICRAKEPGGHGHWATDHTVKRGKVVIRGILCNSCNLGLGKFKDSPKLLMAAANYLTR